MWRAWPIFNKKWWFRICDSKTMQIIIIILLSSSATVVLLWRIRHLFRHKALTIRHQCPNVCKESSMEISKKSCKNSVHVTAKKSRGEIIMTTESPSATEEHNERSKHFTVAFDTQSDNGAKSEIIREISFTRAFPGNESSTVIKLDDYTRETKSSSLSFFILSCFSRAVWKNHKSKWEHNLLKIF